MVAPSTPSLTPSVSTVHIGDEQHTIAIYNGSAGFHNFFLFVVCVWGGRKSLRVSKGQDPPGAPTYLCASIIGVRQLQKFQQDY